MSKVLVTGGSGFIGSHCILQLLEAGHEVRTTVRNLAREGDVRAMLAKGGWTGPAERLTFAQADLEKDAGWAEATTGCDYVLHVASPFPAGVPKDENELIVPAREAPCACFAPRGTLGVKRVVLTSSFAAIGYGHPQQTAPFTEADWTVVDGDDTTAYAKSKTLAERAAWDFMAEGGAMELAVVNPVGVFGPVLGADFSTSILLVQRLVNGDVPGCPNLTFGGVDVRDVADLHIKAMTDPAAKGERFLAVAGNFIPMVAMAKALKAGLGPVAGARVPTRVLPNWVVRMVAMFDPAVKVISAELGKVKNATSEKAIRLLGWKPRSVEESLMASAESLAGLGLLKGSATAG